MVLLISATANMELGDDKPFSSGKCQLKKKKRLNANLVIIDIVGGRINLYGVTQL